MLVKKEYKLISVDHPVFTRTGLKQGLRFTRTGLKQFTKGTSHARLLGNNGRWRHLAYFRKAVICM